jgi:hypothetical protein
MTALQACAAASAGGIVEAVLGSGRRGKSVGIDHIVRRVADSAMVALRRPSGASDLLDKAASVLGAFAYTSSGVLDARRGRTYATWMPVRTAA